MEAISKNKNFRGSSEEPNHPSKPYLFDMHKQTDIDKLPEDWEESMLKLLIDLHYNSMPDEVKINAIFSLGELIDLGFLYKPFFFLYMKRTEQEKRYESTTITVVIANNNTVSNLSHSVDGCETVYIAPSSVM